MIGASMAVRPPRSRGPVLMMIDALRRLGGSLWMVDNAFSGAFVDNVGTQPVTAYGDLLGLTTDRLGVLGLNVFSDAAVVFGGESSRLSPGVYRIYSSAGAFSNITQTSGLAPYKTYRLRFYTDSVTAGSLAIDGPEGSVVASVSAGVGEKECVITMTASVAVSIKRSSGVTDIQISNLRIEELTGSHATQSAVASKPSVQRVPKRTRGATNLLLWSGDFSNAAWTTSKSAGATVGALSTGPDGLQSARIVTFASASDYLYQGLTEYPAVTGASVTSSTIVNSATRAIFYGGSTPAGTDVFAVYDMGSGWWLQTLTRTFTTTTSALTVQVLPGLVAGTFAYHRAALFTGTVTAAQIVDGGGIPLTTTTALPNVTEWANVISFDGSNDFLQTGITTGNEGFVAAGVTPIQVTTAATVFNAGATSDASKGVWLYLNAGNWVFRVGNGTARADPGAVTASAGVPVVVSGGWTASTVMLDKDGATVSAARSGDCTSPTAAIVGAITSGTIPFSGPMHAIAYTPVLPDAATRKIIRDGIAALQGRTL